MQIDAQVYRVGTIKVSTIGISDEHGRYWSCNLGLGLAAGSFRDSYGTLGVGRGGFLVII